MQGVFAISYPGICEKIGHGIYWTKARSQGTRSTTQHLNLATSVISSATSRFETEEQGARTTKL